MALEPQRTVAELQELRALTGDENGAQRVAWTETWEKARTWLRGLLGSTGAREEIDPAGNQWFTLDAGPGAALIIGTVTHRFSAERRLARPGALNVVAGVGGAGVGSPPKGRRRAQSVS